jgi:hypothetical protein
MFALTPLVRALRSASVPAKVSAAVSTGLMMMCIIDPLPEEPTNSMALGIALGSALAFATLGRRDDWKLKDEEVDDVSDDEGADAASAPARVSRAEATP